MPALRPHEEAAMSLAEAIAGLAAARGLKPAEVAESIAGIRNRATFYRVLSGDTEDPRLSTLVALCNALDVTPGELLKVAGLPDAAAVESAARDVTLRHAMRDVQDLAAGDGQLVLALVRSVVQARGRRGA
jgi:DNA-binding Xre family transcriptional regulator